MRRIGIRYYDNLLTEGNFIAMAQGGMTATELCCVRKPLELDFKKTREYADISDYDFIQERHWFSGEGKIDWPKLYAKLCQIGYVGAWTYEPSPGVKNDMRSRELTVRDFYNNAMEIFAGKIPSGI